MILRHETDQEMYESCDIVIEMFDSSFWEVFSNDEALINRLAKKFKEIKFLNPDFLDGVYEMEDLRDHAQHYLT